MSFWTGFFVGIAATYAFSIAVLAAIFLLCRRRVIHFPPEPRERSFCPEYPDISFTHLSGIGDRVRGSDG